MASSSKRSWKLQEFTAHNANVNCLALGHKSGRVLATGGDDKKVNLWAVGKPNCIMSLSGHATPIESVRFNNTEELVCAGSQTGALKVWDLEAAKLIKSLTGHKSGISTLDFHPYGDFIASGSHDCSIKLWDPRRKGCILTFIGHRNKVNSLKFSPDGQWIASSGEDAIIKVWDLRQGRTIQEFTDHTNSVTSVEFHPHDFLLASGGLDRTVNFWDLENFQLVSSEKDVGAVKCLWFNPDGECLFTGVTDSLKVVGWEPARLFDSIPIGWGKVQDIATAHHQLVGASFHLTNVTVYIVDTKKVQPFGGPTPEIPTSPFSSGQSIRKSFSKERPVSLRSKQKLDVKTIEESTSGTDPEEDVTADITNIKDYSEVFQPNRSCKFMQTNSDEPLSPIISVTRTPPLSEPFQAPESDADPSEPQILSAPEDDYTSFTLHQLNLNENSSPPRIRYSPPQLKKSPPRVRLSPPESYSSPPRSLNSEPEPENHRIPTSTPYSRSQSNLEQVFKSRENKNDNLMSRLRSTKYELQRQYSSKDIPEKLPNTNHHNYHNNNNNNNNNHHNNGIKHSASEANINSSCSNNTHFPKASRSRKNSLSNLSTKSSTSSTSRNSSIPNLSRIPNPVSNKGNIEDHVAFKSLKPHATTAPTPTSTTTTTASTGKYGSSSYAQHAHIDEPMFKKPEAPKPLRHDDYGMKRSDPVDIKMTSTGERSAGAGPSPKAKFSPDYDRSSFVPTPSDRPIGLDLEEFLPSNLRTAAYNNRLQDESEEDALDALAKDHNSTLALLTARAKALRMSYQHFRNSPDSKIAVERVLNMKDMAVIHDVLNVLINRQSFWSLDMCVLVLPKIHELIQSRLELHIKTGCEAVKLTLRSFSSLIRSNMLSPCSGYSVDIPREERYHKCRKCYDALMDIRMTLSGKQSIGGEIGNIFKELYAELNQLCIENHAS